MNRSSYSGKIASGVDEAISFVTILVDARRGRGGNKTQIFKQVAAEAKVRATEIRNLYQPSRRPKEVGHGVWRRIHDRYCAFLRVKLAELENEIARVEALDRLDCSTRADLVGKAQALITLINQSL